MTDGIFNRLWLDSDELFKTQIDKLVRIFDDQLDNWWDIQQVADAISERVIVELLIQPDKGLIDTDEVVQYIRDDVTEWLGNR